MVSYLIQCHIGINVNHLFVIILQYTCCFLHFSCRSWPKNKQIDHISKIMSKRHGAFIDNFTIFLLNSEKTGNLPEFEFDKFYKNIFSRSYKCNIYIVTTTVLDFKQLYIFYRFDPITPIYLSKRIPYSPHRHVTF